MTDEKTKRVTVYLTDEQVARLEVIKRKRETDTDTRTMSWLVDDEWRRVLEHNTKEDALARIEAALATQERKTNVAMLLLWRLLACEKVELTADDVRRFRELVAEIQL
jgi:hypothetical protein